MRLINTLYWLRLINTLYWLRLINTLYNEANKPLTSCSDHKITNHHVVTMRILMVRPRDFSWYYEISHHETMRASCGGGRPDQEIYHENISCYHEKFHSEIMRYLTVRP
jgi:hypothetical protein